MIYFKNILLVILLITPVLLSAQKSKKLSKSEKKALALYEREFGVESDAFKVSSIPDKFSDESSVILAKKSHLVFGKVRGKSEYQIATRKRIMLNDQASVTDYSEFYYQNSDLFGISIIKPDGKSIEVNLDNSVEVTTDVPRKYRDRYQRDDYKKVAIPNLQSGDIIDFYKVFSQEEFIQTEYIIPMISTQPTLHQELTFDLDKYVTLYYGSLNGAPELIEDLDGGYDLKGKKTGKVKRIKYEYTNAESKEWERWSDEKDEGPMVKLMISPLGTSLHQKTVLVNGLESEEYISNSMVGVKKITKLLYKSLATYVFSLKLKKIEDSDAAEALYRGLRILLLNSMTGNQVQHIEGISRAISREENGFSDAIFASIFAKFLDKSKIECDIVLAKRRSANPNDFLVGQEVTMGVYIPQIDKYYWPFSRFIRPGDTPYYLQGLEVTHIPYAQVFKDNAAAFSKTSILPSSKLEDNVFKIVGEAKIGEDNKLTYNGRLNMSGYFRLVYSPMFLFHSNYLSDDMFFSEVNKLYQSNMYTFTTKNKKKSRTTEENEEFKKIRDENIESWLEREYTELEVNNFSIFDFGMMNEKKELEVTYNYSSDGFVKKAGPNLIFDVGKVFGSQLQLDKDELEGRRSGVRIDCPKSIVTETTITIPEGLIANGLEDLNMSVENEVGSFISSANQEGNVIKLTTTKLYKIETFGSEKWPLMVEFQEAGYELSQKKLILK